MPAHNGSGGIIVPVPDYPPSHRLTFSGAIIDLTVDGIPVGSAAAAGGFTFALGDVLGGSLDYHLDGGIGDIDPAGHAVYVQRVDAGALTAGHAVFPGPVDDGSAWGSISLSDNVLDALDREHDLMRVEFAQSVSAADGETYSRIAVSLYDYTAASLDGLALPDATDLPLFDVADRQVTGTLKITEERPDGSQLHALALLDAVEVVLLDRPAERQATLTARVDDAYELYLNGALILSDDNYKDAETAALTLAPGDVLALRAEDRGGPGRALVDIAFADGTRLATSPAWLVSTTAPAGWTDPSFDDSGWQPAAVQGDITDFTDWTKAPYLPADTPGLWLWSDDAYGDDRVYLRFTIPDPDAAPPPPPVPTNTAPVVAVPLADTSTRVGVAVDLKVPTGTFTDADPGDTLSLAATRADGRRLPAWLAFENGEFQGTPGAGDAGALDVKVTATDQAGASIADVFRINVEPAETPPPDPGPAPVARMATVTARVDDAYELFLNGARILADDSFKDAESTRVAIAAGDIFTLHAADTGGPGRAFVDIAVEGGPRLGTSADWLVRTTPDGGAWQAASVYGDIGDFTAWTRAPYLPADTPGLWIWTDDAYGDDSAYFRYVVPELTGAVPEPANSPPRVAAPLADASAEVGTLFALTLPPGTFVDADPRDALTFEAARAGGSALPGWLDFDGTGLAGTPTAGDIGGINIRVTATDTAGASVSDTFRLEVEDSSPSPEVEARPATLTARVDDAYDLYLNGNLILSDDNYKDAERVELMLAPGDVLAMGAEDRGGPGRAFIDIAFDDGTRLATSAEWLASTTAPGNWTAADYADGSWAPATVQGNVGDFSQWSKAPYLPSDSPGAWIWSDDVRGDDRVYFRYTVPEPEAALDIAADGGIL